MNKDKRTISQNRMLHLYFELLAKTLNSAGLDMKEVLKPGIDIPWTKDMVKEHLWRPIQEAYVKKESTKDLTKKELNDVFDILNRHLGEKFGIHEELPSTERMMEMEEEKLNKIK